MDAVPGVHLRVGQLHSMMTPPPPSDEATRKRSASDFVFGKVIGEGSFSTVYLAKDIHTNKEFAIKVLEKRHMIREKKMEYVLREKKVLQILSGCPNYFVKLYCTFQDTERLYFVLTYAKNGELLSFLNKKGLWNIECTKYYATELVLALEELKFKEIVHRDLKPENILFDENWHILLIDFGSAKIVSSNEDKIENEDETKKRKNSFVGTAQYVSPELLKNTETGYASDLWALGCIIYQMVSGLHPFHAGSEYLIFQKILKLEYEFPENFDKTAKDLVEKLLVLNPDKRLGATDIKPYSSIRQHEFFSDIDWDNIGPPPKFIPSSPGSSNTLDKDNKIPDHLEPGLNAEKASRLQLDMLCRPTNNTPTRKKSEGSRNVTSLESSEIERRLELQKLDKWHNLVEGNLILKQGLVDKRKGLFARRRMLLLTFGPNLYYVDPATMVLKGKIPWSAELRTEPKNFKIFFVHTPNRTYYLEDPEGYALEWCKAIDEVHAYYYSRPVLP
ncbi:hypothetical protein RN001_009977 [Aquatica leii]|uniref:3-phosphoinositide-dependent protein kinase 1 n=1 Tax=Aquatica leii TaxID=1421715 RepID=A0AAN7S8D3_9COLE|nr:hypothetical protein RN001_009977 [Aquatica leii]